MLLSKEGSDVALVEFLLRFKGSGASCLEARLGWCRRLRARTRIFARLCADRQEAIAGGKSRSNCVVMTSDDSAEFRIRPGRSRDRGTRGSRSAPLFVNQVQVAVRRAGGNRIRLVGGLWPEARSGKSVSRFNACGRGAEFAGSLPKHAGEWQRDGAGRFRSRRVVVKARVVKLNAQRGPRGAARRGVVSKMVDAHLRYLARDGVTRDGEKSRIYSAFEDHADGHAFIKRGRGDRHQFRFIVAPEDSADMVDLRGFTRELMRQAEIDLATRLDWIAVDHHNTRHPHTHIVMRGVTDDGKILNIAGDYIAHGIRSRASELVTRELGHQSEIELQATLQRELDVERMTRLDQTLLAQQRDQGGVDLRPGEGESYLIREYRSLMDSRVRRLARCGLATEIEPGRWVLAERAEATLRELGERNEVTMTIQRALAVHGLAEARGVGQFVRHGSSIDRSVVGRVLAKGLAGDEMGERRYLVIDGVDALVHHVEFADPSLIEHVQRGMIVEAVPPVSNLTLADSHLAIDAQEEEGRPRGHLARINDSLARQDKDPETLVPFHVRRLGALHRGEQVERIDRDRRRVPNDIIQTGQTSDLSQGTSRPQIRILSSFGLDRQIASDGATWLDRKLAASDPIQVTDAGFGRQVNEALVRRAQRLVEMGYAIFKDGQISVSQSDLAALERQEIARVGGRMASARGRTFQPVKPGEYIGGTLVGSTHLASGRYAMLETLSGERGLGFTLVPWQPSLDSHLGRQITGVMRENGSIDWSFGRKRGLGL
jgi:type IV secretory pathway VirD2 relaxase